MRTCARRDSGSGVKYERAANAKINAVAMLLPVVLDMIQKDGSGKGLPCCKQGEHSAEVRLWMASNRSKFVSKGSRIVALITQIFIIIDHAFFSCFLGCFRALIESLIQSLNFSHGFLLRRLLSCR